MKELKLCPFCGNKPSRDPDGLIICTTCDVIGPEPEAFGDVKSTAAAWNKREGEDES